MPKLEMHAIRKKVEIEVKEEGVTTNNLLKEEGVTTITYSEILRVYVTEELTGP